jgi:flagellar basal-body rod protein FlgF
MDKGIYTAAASIRSDKLRQLNQAHEMSNVSSVGFKKAFQISDKTYRVDGENSLSSRFFKTSVSLGHVDLTPGPRIVTQNPLDVFVEGRGVLGVFNDDDQLAFTRRGDLRLDGNGVLVNGEGRTIASDAGGEIQLDLALLHRISKEGVIYATDTSAEIAVDVEVGRLLLRNAIDTDLEKTSDGLFKPSGPAAPADFEGAEEQVFVTPFGLEGSAVKSYDVLTRMIEIERAFEIKINIIKEMSELSQKSTSLMAIT